MTVRFTYAKHYGRCLEQAVSTGIITTDERDFILAVDREWFEVPDYNGKPGIIERSLERDELLDKCWANYKPNLAT